jgi:hypothetical protein
MTDEYYRQKYVKYKTKYLDLQEELFGGVVPPPIRKDSVYVPIPDYVSFGKKPSASPKISSKNDVNIHRNALLYDPSSSRSSTNSSPKQSPPPYNPEYENGKPISKLIQVGQLSDTSDTGLNVKFRDFILKKICEEIHNLPKTTLVKVDCCLKDLNNFNRLITPSLSENIQKHFGVIERIYMMFVNGIDISIKEYERIKFTEEVDNDNIDRFVRTKFLHIYEDIESHVLELLKQIDKFDIYYDLQLFKFPPYNILLPPNMQAKKSVCHAQDMNINCIIQAFFSKILQMKDILIRLNEYTSEAKASNSTIVDMVGKFKIFTEKFNEMKRKIEDQKVIITIVPEYDEKTGKKEVTETVTYKPMKSFSDELSKIDPRFKAKVDKLMAEAMVDSQKSDNAKLKKSKR